MLFFGGCSRFYGKTVKYYYFFKFQPQHSYKEKRVECNTHHGSKKYNRTPLKGISDLVLPRSRKIQRSDDYLELFF